MKSKPIKFGIRFYANLCWTNGYLPSLVNHGSGNLSKIPPAASYITKFKQLRSAYVKKMKDAPVPKNSASTGWGMQVAHPTHNEPAPQGRSVVADNFYTRPLLGMQNREVTNDETAVMETVCLNNMEARNRNVTKDPMKQLEAEHGDCWHLCQAYIRQGKGRDVSVQTILYAGVVVWKDRTVVIFFSNDLQDTPTALVMASDTHAIKCVQGPSKIQQWRGTESMHPKTMEVPTRAMACNLFMNGMSCFDQQRAALTTAPKEQRVAMPVFIFLLDAGIQNEYAVYKSIHTQDEALITLREFKRLVAEDLDAPKLTQ